MAACSWLAGTACGAGGSGDGVWDCAAAPTACAARIRSRTHARRVKPALPCNGSPRHRAARLPAHTSVGDGFAIELQRELKVRLLVAREFDRVVRRVARRAIASVSCANGGPQSLEAEIGDAVGLQEFG